MSANGALGGNNYACTSTSTLNSNREAWLAFDKQSTYNGRWGSFMATSNPSYIIFYSPVPINLRYVTITNNNGYQLSATGYFAMKTGVIHGSNDNETWYELTTITNSVTTYGAQWLVTVPGLNHYKYFRITCNSVSNTVSGQYWSCEEILLEGYRKGQIDLVDTLWGSTTQSAYFIKY